MSAASTRTPGATAFTDPNTPTSGFYRSLVGDRGLMTKEITGGFAVPGRAAPKAAGAPVYADPRASTDLAALTPLAVLPASTRLKVLETVSGIKTIDEVLPDAFGPRQLAAFRGAGS